MDLGEASAFGEWPYPRDEVFDALGHAAVTTPDVALESRDRQSGRLILRGAKGLLSPGERISISVRETGPGQSQVNIDRIEEASAD